MILLFYLEKNMRDKLFSPLLHDFNKKYTGFNNTQAVIVMYLQKNSKNNEFIELPIKAIKEFCNGMFTLLELKNARSSLVKKGFIKVKKKCLGHACLCRKSLSESLSDDFFNSIDNHTSSSVCDTLVSELSSLGAFKWHNNRDSYYIKFKDTRVGSIRISNHNGRERYNYTWEIFTSSDCTSTIGYVIDSVREKILNISNFDPNKYIVFINGRYKEVSSLDEYKQAIFKRGKA